MAIFTIPLASSMKTISNENKDYFYKMLAQECVDRIVEAAEMGKTRLVFDVSYKNAVDVCRLCEELTDQGYAVEKKETTTGYLSMIDYAQLIISWKDAEADKLKEYSF